MRVAVIGGGFSGLLAAYLLEKEGIDVTVYEKEEQAGGHCKTLVSKNINIDIGTVCSFTGNIKELLIQLQVDYVERFLYRNFVDENYNSVEHMLRDDVLLLMDELSNLSKILSKYASYLDDINYGYIPDDLNVSLKDFLKSNGLNLICQLISPYLSSFGFGSMDKVQAYYVFKIFDLNTIYAFVIGKKSLFIKNGTKELINKLCENISNIRYSIEVKSIETIQNKVKIDTLYDTESFDKVLISTKIPENIIKDTVYNEFMKNINTNPFILCAYEIFNTDLITTYYKSHLGKKDKLQFFYIYKQNNRNILLAYSYGKITKDIVNDITADINKLGIKIKTLLTVKQWDIFPHVKSNNLNQSFYQEINRPNSSSNITLIGSLVSKPSIDTLYLSVRSAVNSILKNS